jgi:hypothetical protein
VVVVWFAAMRVPFVFVLFAAIACQPTPPKPVSREPAPMTDPQVTVRVRAGLVEGPLQGRLLVLLAEDASREPRFQVMDDDRTAQVFGVDVEDWWPGQLRTLTGEVAGAPVPSLRALPPGEYMVQAVLHRYETFHRADGKVVQLPMDRGEGQQWSLAPGNLLSTPRKIRVAAGTPLSLEIEVDQVDPRAAAGDGDEAAAARRDREPEADGVLGPQHEARRARAAAGGLGHAPAGPLSADDLPLALRPRAVRIPRDPAGR